MIGSQEAGRADRVIRSRRVLSVETGMFGKSGLKGVSAGRRCFQLRLPLFCLPLRQIVQEEVAEWMLRLVAVVPTITRHCGSARHAGTGTQLVISPYGKLSDMTVHRSIYL